MYLWVNGWVKGTNNITLALRSGPLSNTYNQTIGKRQTLDTSMRFSNFDALPADILRTLLEVDRSAKPHEAPTLW